MIDAFRQAPPEKPDVTETAQLESVELDAVTANGTAIRMAVERIKDITVVRGLDPLEIELVQRRCALLTPLHSIAEVSQRVYNPHAV